MESADKYPLRVLNEKINKENIGHTYKKKKKFMGLF